MENKWKIGLLIGLVAVISIAAIGVTYAANGSLCSFSWVESNDGGNTSNHSGYNPIDPGDKGDDPLAAQAPGVPCSRASYNAASASATYTADTITFNLANAYPGYNPTIFFGLSNQWTTPGIVSSITYANPNPALLTMTLNGVSQNMVIDAGAEAVGALDIAVGNLPQSTTSTNYNLSVTILVTQSGPAFSINPVSLPGGNLGISYSQTLTSSYGNTPCTWAVVSGSLPAGLTLDAATGAISGTPTAAGAYAFTIRVTDNTGDTASISLSIFVPHRPISGGGGGSASVSIPAPTPLPAPSPAPAPAPAQAPSAPPASEPTSSAPGGIIAEINAGFIVNIDGNRTEIPGDEPATASSQTGDVTIQVATGTVALDPAGSKVQEIYIRQTDDVPPAPANTAILKGYDCGPEGTTFNPPLVFTLYYGQLPEGAVGNSLYLASWNGTEWMQVKCTIDTQSGTISTLFNHSSQYAFIMPLTPAPAAPPAQSGNTPLNWWLPIITGIAILALLWFFLIFRRSTEKKLLDFMIKRVKGGVSKQQLLEVEVPRFIKENHLESRSMSDLDKMADQVFKKFYEKN